MLCIHQLIFQEVKTERKSDILAESTRIAQRHFKPKMVVLRLNVKKSSYLQMLFLVISLNQERWHTFGCYRIAYIMNRVPYKA